MKNTKKVFLSLFMALVFVTLSVSVPFAANAEVAYSKLSPDLLSEFESRGNNARINTVLWLNDNTTENYQAQVEKIVPPEAEDFGVVEQNLEQVLLTNSDELNIEYTAEKEAYMEAMQNHIMQKRQIAQAMYYADNSEVAAKLESELSGGEIVYISRYSPLIVCNISRSEAINMAFNSDVLSFSYGEYEAEPQMSVSVQSVSATTLQNSYGILGQGVKVGMLEAATPDTNNTCFSGVENKISLKTMSSATTDSEDINHATAVASVIINPTSGVSRGLDRLYAVASSTYAEFFGSVEWLLNQGVNVINLSISFAKLTQYDYSSSWMDHIAYNHSVHCVIAVGNSSNRSVSNIAMAYNIIAVGNTDNKDTVTCADDVLEEDSAYNRLYDFLPHKPDLCAPGTNLAVPGQYFLCNGTSVSAPHVVGIVALLCSYKPDLLTKQTLMKSILMTGVSTKKRFDTCDQNEYIDSYKQYGAGVVNAYNAKRIIDTNKYINSSMQSTQTIKTYSLGTIQAGQTVSVTLCFLKRTKFTSSDHTENGPMANNYLANLNLDVKGASTPTHQTPLATSTTTNNNVEKIIFTAPTTDEYNIIVSKSETHQDPYEILFAVSWLVDSIDLP